MADREADAAKHTVAVRCVGKVTDAVETATKTATETATKGGVVVGPVAGIGSRVQNVI